MQTIISPQTHSADEHAIVHLLTPDAREQVTLVQAKLIEFFGDAIWLSQSSSLHVTLMEVINDTKYEGLTRSQHFEKWHKHYNQETKQVVAQIAPFDITFTELVVSRRAIILKTKSSEQFNNVRSSILAKTELPQCTKLPPDITHCSLARFNTAINLEQAQSLTRGIIVNLIEHIQDFSLIKDLGPPDFNNVPLETYTLSTTKV